MMIGKREFALAVLAVAFGSAGAPAQDVEAAGGDDQYNQQIYLGDQYRSSGLPGKAAEEYEKALVMDPTNPGVYARLGYALIEADSLEKAVKIYQRYVDLEPKNCDAHASLGFAYFQQKLTDQAIRSYERARELCPDDPNAYTNLGKVYRENYPIEAIEAFRRSVELNPDDILGYENLARLYFVRKLYPEAIRMYESILDHPDNGKDARWTSWAHSRVAAMYRWADAFTNAIPHFQAVLATPNVDEGLKTRAIRGLAISYEKTGQIALAIELYDDLIAQVPDNSAYFYRLGELLNDVGRNKDAIQRVKAGQRVDEGCSAHAHCVIGEAYEKLGGLGNYKRAEREFQKAVRCGGSEHYVDYARKQIDRQRQLVKIEELKRKQKVQEGY